MLAFGLIGLGRICADEECLATYLLDITAVHFFLTNLVADGHMLSALTRDMRTSNSYAVQ